MATDGRLRLRTHPLLSRSTGPRQSFASPGPVFSCRLARIGFPTGTVGLARRAMIPHNNFRKCSVYDTVLLGSGGPASQSRHLGFPVLVKFRAALEHVRLGLFEAAVDSATLYQIARPTGGD